MDPATIAILGPWGPLGIVGSVVIALGYVCYLQWLHIKSLYSAHLRDVKTYADKYAEILSEASRTQTALAHAIERIGDKIR